MALTAKIIERSLLVCGAALCLVYLGAAIFRSASSRLAMRSLDTTKAVTEPAAVHGVDLPSSAVDFRSWAATRIGAYQDSLARQFSPPVAVLRIPKVRIEVPVFDGTDELILNRGVGRIPGTARPGEAGNIGIAGHRDGFFRGLKEIAVGDSVTLDTGAKVSLYVVDGIRIVSPKDITVLARTSVSSITLVTCYPFYYVGDAPRRYIVRCVLKETQSGSGGSNAASSQ